MKKILSVCLVAALFGWGAASGQTSSNFFAVDTIQEIKITFEQNNWRYILDSLRYNGDGLLLGDVELNGQVFRDVGVRYRDGRTFKPGQARNGLFIDLDFINTAQHYQGRRAVNLSSALRDPSLVREVLAYEIARQYMPAPQANFARVRVNNDYYGVFVNVEPVDATFLERYAGTGQGSLFFSQPNPEAPLPAGCRSGVGGSLMHDSKARCYLNNFAILSEKGWDELIELTRVVDQEPEKIESVLDIDKTLWMLAFNNLLVNLSSYSGQNSPNYFLFKPKNGVFTPILWDLNLAFGSYKNTGQGSDLRLDALEKLDPLLHADNTSKPLIHHLLSNETYKKIYLAHLRTMLREQFDKGNFAERAKKLQELIRSSYLVDNNRFYPESDFNRSLGETIGDRSQIPGIVSFMNKRLEFLKHHPLLTVVAPEVGELELERRQQFSSTQISDFQLRVKVGKMPRRVTLFYRMDPAGAFRQARMLDDGKHNDGEANDGVFGVRVSPEGGLRTMQYYLVAENAGAVSFYPQRYMFEPLSVSLDELNK